MKRILCVLLCAVVSSAVSLSSVVSAETQDGAEQEAAVYETIEFSDEKGEYVCSDKAVFESTLTRTVDYVNFNATMPGIVLKKSVRLDNGITLYSLKEAAGFILIDGDVEIDLCGNFITQMSGVRMSDQPLIIVPDGSSLRITDSSEKGDGVINGVQCAIWARGGNVTVDGGMIIAQSESGQMPDEYELPIKVTDGGCLVVNGGVIEFNGMLEDGRSYSMRSCAVYADSESRVLVSGGEIKGEIECENSTALSITGGTFDRDVSEYIIGIYECVKNGERYNVEKSTPEVSGFYNETAIKTNTDVLYDESNTAVCEYFVSALSETGFRNNTKLEISQLFEDEGLFSDEMPELELQTDIASFRFDRRAVRRIADECKNGKLYFEVSRTDSVGEKNKRLLKSAKREISYGFCRADGSRAEIKAECTVKVPYLSETLEQNIRVYSVSGSSTSIKMSRYENGTVVYKTDGAETILIAEGSVISIQGKAVDLQGTISLVFYAALEGIDASSAKMMFWESPQSDYTEKTADRVVECSGKDMNGYKFEYKNISSKDMNKKIYARLKALDNDGNVIYSDVPREGYSVIKYAENMMSNEKLKPLLIRMLNYGTAAQEYFGSDDAPANSILKEGERATDFTRIYTSRAQTIEESTGGIKTSAVIRGKTLLLDGDISIKYYTEMNESADEMGILFWTENAFRATNTHVLGTESGFTNAFEVNGAYKVFTYGNIVSSAMNNQIYARIYTRHGSEYRYGDIDSYSVRDYAANQMAKGGDEKLVRLLRTLMLYGDEAEKYFKVSIVE